MDFNQHQLIFQDGESFQEYGGVYFLYSGAVEAYLLNQGDMKIPLGDTTRGFFGEVALLHDGKRSANVRATRHTITLLVDAAPFLNLLTTHPEIMLAMMREMASRLSRTSSDIRLTNVRDVNALIKKNAGQDAGAVQDVARFFGNVRFLYLALPVCAAWSAAAVFAWQGRYFDRVMGLLSLLVSLVAIVVTCVVLHSQNQQAAQNKTLNDEVTAANFRADIGIQQLHEQLKTLGSDVLERLPARPTTAALPAATVTPDLTHKDDTPR